MVKMRDYMFDSYELTITLGPTITIQTNNRKYTEWHDFVKEHTKCVKKYRCTHLGVMSTGDYYIVKNPEGYDMDFLSRTIGEYVYGWLLSNYAHLSYHELHEKKMSVMMDVLDEMCRHYGYPLLKDAVASSDYVEEEYTCLLEFLGNKRNYEIHSKGKPLCVQHDDKYTQIVPRVSVRALIADVGIIEIAGKYNLRIPAQVICIRSSLYHVHILRDFPIEDYNFVGLFHGPAYLSVTRAYFQVPGVIRVSKDTPDTITNRELRKYAYVQRVETLPLLNTSRSHRKRWQPYEDPLSLTYV